MVTEYPDCSPFPVCVTISEPTSCLCLVFWTCWSWENSKAGRQRVSAHGLAKAGKESSFVANG